jgi:hypothetical protein
MLTGLAKANKKVLACRPTFSTHSRSKLADLTDHALTNTHSRSKLADFVVLYIGAGEV